MSTKQSLPINMEYFRTTSAHVHGIKQIFKFHSTNKAPLHHLSVGRKMNGNFTSLAIYPHGRGDNLSEENFRVQ